MEEAAQVASGAEARQQWLNAALFNIAAQLFNRNRYISLLASSSSP